MTLGYELFVLKERLWEPPFCIWAGARVNPQAPSAQLLQLWSDVCTQKPQLGSLYTHGQHTQMGTRFLGTRHDAVDLATWAGCER